MSMAFKVQRPPHPALEHISRLIRAYLEQEGITATMLGVRLGMTGSYASVFKWTNGQNAPTNHWRPKLAEVLGVPEVELRRRPEPPRGRPRKDITAVAESNVRALEAHLEAPAGRSHPTLPAPPQKVQPVLSYVVGPDGQGELRVTARGPHRRLAPIFRMLMDAGMAPDGEDEQP